MDEFSRSLPKILVIEGGYSNNKNDPGGPTNKGIIQREYNEFRTTKGLAIQSVQLIADEEVSAIYRTKYWDGVKGDKLSAGVSYVVFDGAVNSGVAQSVKWLQRALKALGLYQGAIDGNIGQGTLLAAAGVNDNDNLIAAIIERREAFLHALKTYKYFGKGWMSRCAVVLAVGQAWASGSVGPEIGPIENAGAKAFISDAKAEPLAGIGHTVAGIGVGTGGITTYIDTAKEKLAAYAGVNQLVDHAVMYLTIASVVLVGAGAAWATVNSQLKSARSDALDLPTSPTSAQATPA